MLQHAQASRRMGGLAALWVVGLAAGCSNGIDPDYGALGLVEVTGAVWLEEEPLRGAMVIFESADGTFSYATTDDQGRYRLRFNSERTGVLPGRKTVRIRTAGADRGDPHFEDPDLESFSTERLPAVYHQQSRLTVTVAAHNSTVDIRLKADGSTLLQGGPPASR